MTDTELDAIAAELNAVLTNPDHCRFVTAAGAPPDTDRARMIHQAGLEAVRKALDTSP